jgi:ribosomal protein S8
MRSNSVFFLLSQIKVAFKHKKNNIKVLRTLLNKSILESMYRQGFISYFKLSNDRNFFVVFFKNKSVLNNYFLHLQPKSTSSRFEFLSYDKIQKKYRPSDFFIVLTSRGVLISEEVFFFKLGGEILCDSLSYN